MRKILLVTSVLLLAGLTACKNTVTETVYVEKPATPKTTTVMVYMIGSDLLEGAENNIASMLEAESSDKLNVVIQTGAGNATVYGNLSNPQVNWTKVNRYTVKKGKLIKATDFEEQDSSTSSGLNMLTNTALIDFLDYSQENYPADRYMLILWNHGGGPIDGYGSESTLGNENFSLKDLYDVLKQAKIRHYDLIGFDACLMGSIEIANTLSPFTDYLLASEEIEPGEGWRYKEFLTEFATNPSVSIERIGKIIADNYLDNNKDSSHTTLSLIETTDHSMDKIIAALDTVASKLSSQFQSKDQETYYKYIRAKLDSRKYHNDYLVDGINFAENLKLWFFRNSSSEVSNLINVYRDSVVYDVAATLYQEGSNGLTMYAPLFHGNYFTEYKDLYQSGVADMTFSPEYIRFLEKIFTYQESLEQDTTFTKLVYDNTTKKASATFECPLSFETISVITDTSDEPGIQAATAGLVTDWGIQEDYITYECEYLNTDKLFMCGNELLYLTLNKKLYPNKKIYEIHLPSYLFYREEWQGGELVFKYDFDANEILSGMSFLIPGEIPPPLEENSEIKLATVTFDAKTGDKTITQTGDGLTLAAFMKSFTYGSVTGSMSEYFEVVDVLGKSHFSTTSLQKAGTENPTE